MYVAKVSLPGYDAKAATPEQCVVHSSYPPLKAKVGQAQPHIATLNVTFTNFITQNSTIILYSPNHNYGYIPFNLSSIVITGVDNFFNPYTISGLGYAGVGATLAIEAYCTTTQFIVTIYDDANWINNTARLQVSYYIFAEDGA